MPGRAKKTRSTLGRESCESLKDSLTSRLTRLRHTARFRTFLGTISPSRGVVCSFLQARMSMPLPPARTGFLNTWLYSSELSSLSSRGKAELGIYLQIRRRDACGPWHDDGKEPCGHQQYAYAYGNRGCAYALKRLAEKYASFEYFSRGWHCHPTVPW